MAPGQPDSLRPCPYCGGNATPAHYQFRKGKSPSAFTDRMWLHTCGPCGFTAYLSGDRERDLKRENVFGPTPPPGAPSS